MRDLDRRSIQRRASAGSDERERCRQICPPALGDSSRRMTRRPDPAALTAAAMPAGPAPPTTTSLASDAGEAPSAGGEVVAGSSAAVMVATPQRSPWHPSRPAFLQSLE